MAGNIRCCYMNNRKYIWPFCPCLFCLPHSLHMSGVSVDAWFVARAADTSTKTFLAFLQEAWSHIQSAEQTISPEFTTVPKSFIVKHSAVSHDKHVVVWRPWANVELVQWSVHSRYRVLFIHAKCSFDMHELSSKKHNFWQSPNVPTRMGKMKAHGATIGL